MEKNVEQATFAGGCFWCTEAIFKRLKGVMSVMSGYTGGAMLNPTYDQVASGTTGHAEAITITFDKTIIPYEKLVQIFFATHDPTTKDQQGADIGNQYHSAIFYHTDEQKRIAEKIKQQLTQEATYPSPIVTEIVPFTAFYTAEEYHRNFYDKNREYPYCQVIIDPKIQKLLKEFKKEIKEE